MCAPDCKTLAPVYEELAKDFEFAKDKVVIAKVDADSEKALGKRFGVQGFPTLKWFDGKSDKPTDYTGGRDLESLTEFISKKTGIKPKKAKPAPAATEILTDKTFKEKVGGDKNVLVSFTAPWCGRKCSTYDDDPGGKLTALQQIARTLSQCMSSLQRTSLTRMMSW